MKTTKKIVIKIAWSVLIVVTMMVAMLGIGLLAELTAKFVRVSLEKPREVAMLAYDLANLTGMVAIGFLPNLSFWFKQREYRRPIVMSWLAYMAVLFMMSGILKLIL